MPRSKKTTTIVEEEPLTAAEEVTAIQESQLLKDTPPEEPITPEEPKKDEDEEEVEVDLDEFKKQLKDEAKAELREDLTKEVSQATADKINAALNQDHKATGDEKDKYVKIAEEFEKTNGRPPQWHELVPYMIAEAKESLKADQLAEQKQAEDAQKQVKEQQDKQNEAFDQYALEQLNDLTTSGKLPPIKDAKDKEDYGIKVRQALFAKMTEVNQERVKAGKQPIWSIKEIYYEHFTPPTEEVAGADAPIDMGHGGQVNNKTEEINYDEIHRARSIMDIITGNRR